MSDREILEMVFFPVVNEACRVLDEGIVVRASDLDAACILGMSFPKYRLVKWLLYMFLCSRFSHQCFVSVLDIFHLS